MIFGNCFEFEIHGRRYCNGSVKLDLNYKGNVLYVLKKYATMNYFRRRYIETNIGNSLVISDFTGATKLKLVTSDA